MLILMMQWQSRGGGVPADAWLAVMVFSLHVVVARAPEHAEMMHEGHPQWNPLAEVVGGAVLAVS